MRQYKKGDIIDIIEVLKNEHKGKIVLIHGCNCFNTMGSGLALVLKNNYPKAYEVDCETIKGDKNKLGKYTIANINDYLTIVNAYTQYAYGRGLKIDYGALETALTSIVTNLMGSDILYLVPKYIGCGLAGGDIDIVTPIIDNVFTNYNLCLFES